MTDSFQEISHQNIVSRIAKAFVGAVVGLVLLLVAFGPPRLEREPRRRRASRPEGGRADRRRGRAIAG